MGVRCFYLEPTGETRLSLRVFESCDPGACVSWPTAGFHNAHNPLLDTPVRRVHETDGDDHHWHYEHDGPQRPEDVSDAHTWPTQCTCGYAFTVKAQRQVFSDRLYRRTDTGEVRTLREWERVEGAMWNAEWLADLADGRYTGSDGRSLHVICPGGGQWAIDGPASNCTKPNDKKHRCWIRHGEPPLITVDKNGRTCSAGAGSIIAGKYHGFLRNGVFEP